MQTVQPSQIGLDAGSVRSVKLVSIDAGGARKRSLYKRHKGHPLALACEMLDTVCRDETHRDISLSVTGSAGRLIASILGIGFTNEVLSQAYATQHLYPHIKTIFELGGEDAKLSPST